MSGLGSDVWALTESMLDLLMNSDYTPISSDLLGMVPEITTSVIVDLLSWSDSFSFACYLCFIFNVIGPMFMAFSYLFVKLEKEEKKLAKKYKFKKVQIKMCGKIDDRVYKTGLSG